MNTPIELKLAETGLQGDPEKALELVRAGRRQMRLFDLEGYEAAVVSLIQAVQTDPECSLAHASLAETYSYWGFRRELNGQECVSYYGLSLDSAVQALQLAPESACSHRAMAMALRRGAAKDPQRRKDEISRALSIDSNDAESWYENWRAFGYDPGEPSIHRALELDPLLCAAHLDLGVALCEDGRMKESLDELTMALKLCPRNSLAHYNLAMVLDRQGRTDVAVKVLGRAQTLHPGDPLITSGIMLLKGEAYAAP
jgi:tetratricopeptide (TPR) repeat protein